MTDSAGAADRSPTRLLVDPPLTLEGYVARGGGSGLDRARALGPAATIAELETAGLRGRGGAGFPTAVKWRSVAGAGAGTRYVVGNGAEGEPGTFKDRALIRANPYAVVEGLVIAALTVGATEALHRRQGRLRARRSARLRRGDGGDGRRPASSPSRGHLVTGPEEYLFGEEKALLEVIEGGDPLPRWLPALPPRPVRHRPAARMGGRHDAGAPATPAGRRVEPDPGQQRRDPGQRRAWILRQRRRGFRSVGTERLPGHGPRHHRRRRRPARAWSRSELGTPLAGLLDRAAAARRGPSLQGGRSRGWPNAVLTAADLDIPLTYEDFEPVGSGLGAGRLIVYDDTACMVEVASLISRFLYVESCGQCPPCKLGTGADHRRPRRIRDGSGARPRPRPHPGTLADGHRRQPLLSSPCRSAAWCRACCARFPSDFAAHLDGWCPSIAPGTSLPKLVDLEDGVATYDLAQARKQPDWTYI